MDYRAVLRKSICQLSVVGFYLIAPMQLVTPSVVRIAVRIAIIVWMMNFQVSSFMTF